VAIPQAGRRLPKQVLQAQQALQVQQARQVPQELWARLVQQVSLEVQGNKARKELLVALVSQVPLG